MLRITIELVPHGIEEKKKIIGLLEIANDGTGNEQYGNYKARFPRHSKAWKESIVTQWPRKAGTVYELVEKVLRALGHVG